MRRICWLLSFTDLVFTYPLFVLHHDNSVRSPSNQILSSSFLTCKFRVRRQPRGSPCTAQITVSSGLFIPGIVTWHIFTPKYCSARFMCIISNSMHCLFLVYLIKLPLHGTSKMTQQARLADSHLRPSATYRHLTSWLWAVGARNM
jgi:hypothetical protein